MRKRFIYNLINVPLGLGVLRGQRGGSIIAAVFLIVVIGFLGAIVVSLVSTQSFQSVGELKSTEALYVADGGIEYALKINTSTCGYVAPDTRPSPNYSCPEWSSRAGATVANPCPSASAITLGWGNFCVDPPTVLTALILAGSTSVPVVSTTGFPAAGRIKIDSEVIVYGSITATSFTGLVTTADHRQNAAVYPVTTLTTDPGAGGTTIAVASTTGFLIPGIITIESEWIHCTGTTVATFTGCTRGFKGSTAAAHASLSSVYQYVITSTGSVSTLVGGTAKRVVRVTVDQ